MVGWLQLWLALHGGIGWSKALDWPKCELRNVLLESEKAEEVLQKKIYEEQVNCLEYVKPHPSPTKAFIRVVAGGYVCSLPPC